MSTRIWSMMDVGKRSLMNSQTALQTVSHNIANKSTEGYSRQRVDIQSNVPVGNGRLRIGMGARATTVSRTNNPFLERQIEREGNKLGQNKTSADMLMRVEQVYNEQVNKGLNKYLGEFFNSFRELSNNPESLAIRSLVYESADNLIKDFSRVNNQLKQVQFEADYQIKNTITEVNEITREIASLNEKIQSIEINAQEANDERDRRDLLLKKLSEKINIRYAEGDDGSVTVNAGNTAIIVSGHSSIDLQVSETSRRKGKQEGNVDIFYKATESGDPQRITEQINGGEIGGLLKIRDVTINELLDNMDFMAYNMAYDVNEAHQLGVTGNNEKAKAFFQIPTETDEIAGNLKIHSDIIKDVNNIAAGAAQNSPGDNRVANVISSLQYQKNVKNGTYDDFYSNMVGKLGIQTKRANNDVESQNDIVKQLSTIRESISGVSLDEETAKMIEFQKTYDASARLIRTADEMMDTVLNLKRV